VSSLFEPIIIVWNSVRYITDENDELLQNSVFVSGGIALVIRVITICFMIIVMNNFNKGLKQKVYGKKDQNTSMDTNQEVIT